VGPVADVELVLVALVEVAAGIEFVLELFVLAGTADVDGVFVCRGASCCEKTIPIINKHDKKKTAMVVMPQFGNAGRAG